MVVAPLAVGAGVALWASGITSWLDELRGMRPATRAESFSRYVAQELAAPELCQKISWAAEEPGGFFIATSYVRSQCYAFIAGRTRNVSLCWRVRRLGVLRPLDEQMSKWACLRDALRGMNAGIAVSSTDLTDFFARMRYDPDSLHLEGVTPPIVAVRDEYLRLEAAPDIVDRVSHLLGSSSVMPRASTDRLDTAYLADVAALVSRDPDWCERIPRDLPLATQRAGFHDWCLFTLATNTKDETLCSRLPATPPGPGQSLQSLCQFQARPRHPTNVQYGPEVPDDARARRLIVMLGYSITRASDLPVERLAAAEGVFLEALEAGKDSVHAAARRRFIARVEQLPD